MNQRVLIIGSLVFLLIIIFGIYLFTRDTKYDNLTLQKNQLEKNLILAEEKLKEEEQKLDEMLAELRQSYPLSFTIQDQMKKAYGLVSKTDFLFSSNILGGSLTSQRKDINLLLSEWQKKITILAIDKINKQESEIIKKEAETIKAYLQSILAALANLTPENSSLTQAEINAYMAQLPTTAEINDILAAIQNAIDNLTNSANPTITPEEVAAQQEVVNNAQEEVNNTQHELDEIEEELEEVYPYPTPAYVTPAYLTPGEAYATPYTTPEITPIPEEDYSYQTPETYTGGEPLPYYPTPYSKPKYPGIIVQPGPPQLIPGSDPY